MNFTGGVTSPGSMRNLSCIERAYEKTWDHRDCSSHAWFCGASGMGFQCSDRGVARKRTGHGRTADVERVLLGRGADTVSGAHLPAEAGMDSGRRFVGIVAGGCNRCAASAPVSGEPDPGIRHGSGFWGIGYFVAVEKSTLEKICHFAGHGDAGGDRFRVHAG